MDLGNLKQIVPARLKRHYRRLRLHINGEYANQPRLRDIDLTRTVVGGEGSYDAVSWAELTGDWQRGSTLLGDSIYVRFLEQYRDFGEKVLERKNFEHTDYFKNALRCIQFLGEYFGQRTLEGIRAQARTFVELYERIKTADLREVSFPSKKDHTQRELPVVRETLTPNTYEIVDGHHRLAAAWVSGSRNARVTVLRPAAPSGLQSLVLKANQTQNGKTLFQPIDGPQFDSSWKVARRCPSRFAAMLDFLGSTKHDLNAVSVLDLACSYGWFVHQFSKKGCASIGIEANAAALQVGRVAYGLRAEQLVQSDFQTFLHNFNRRFEIVLLLGVLNDESLKDSASIREQIFRKIDLITGSVLFFDIEQKSRRGWRNSLLDRDGEFSMRLVKKNTSFTQVLRIGRDSDDGRDNSLLFACCRL